MAVLRTFPDLDRDGGGRRAAVGLGRVSAPEVRGPRAGERRSAKRVDRVYATQERRETGVAHVELGPLDERLRPVREPGLQHRDLVRRRERRQPRGSRRATDADVPGEIGAVEELRRAQCRRTHEALVVPQARDLEELSQVPLEVRRHVGPEKTLRVDGQVLVQLRKPAADQELLDGEARMGRSRLGEDERLELDDAGAAGAAGERVGDRLHEPERLRPGEEEGAGATAVSVDRGLQVAKEAGRVLHLVHDDGRRIPREERRGVAFRLLRLARQIQGDKGVFREQPSHQTRLPGLPRARQHDDRPGCGPLPEERQTGRPGRRLGPPESVAFELGKHHTPAQSPHNSILP